MTARLDKAQRLSEVLAGLGDAGILELIETAEPVGIGIGGTTKTVRLGEVTVFVKQLPLTSLEEADPTATASRIDLPFACHYGIGSPSHGVGRELAAHQLTSRWVQSGEADFFPLLLGWRVVDLKVDADLSEFDGDVSQRQWGTHWPQVERKLSAMKDASKSVVLFLEYVPETLGVWVRRSLTAGTLAEDFADMVVQITDATQWMKTQGLLHFDVHPGNILVREGRLLFTDFGLALCHEFDLTPEEKASIATHEGFDHETALMHLFHWVLFEVGYTSGPQRLELLRAAADDPATPALDPVRVALGSSADLIAQHADAAVYVTEMFGILMQDASAIRYSGPHEREQSAIAS